MTYLEEKEKNNDFKIKDVSYSFNTISLRDKDVILHTKDVEYLKIHQKDFKHIIGCLKSFNAFGKIMENFDDTGCNYEIKKVIVPDEYYGNYITVLWDTQTRVISIMPSSSRTKGIHTNEITNEELRDCFQMVNCVDTIEHAILEYNQLRAGEIIDIDGKVFSKSTTLEALKKYINED